MPITVAVVGTGPVGLMLAGELRLAGVESVVLDRLEEPSGQSRALGFNARTAELLHQRGLLERFLEEGRPVPVSHFAGLPMDLTKLDSRHKYTLSIPQFKVERLLEEHAVESGIEIRRGHEVVGLRQDDEGVVVSVVAGGESYELQCAYLVGCDGGGSTVRGLAGIGFPGTGPRVHGILGDVESIETTVEYRTPLSYPGGIFGVAPIEPSGFRVTTVEYDVQPPDRDTPTLDELRESIRRVTGEEVELGQARWLSRFSDSARLAERYRAGRVLLAGDAAHIHYPQSGQGMSLGIADAANLGWKLAAVVNGRAPDSLLDTYHTERHPAGRSVLTNTEAQKAMTFPAEWVRDLRSLFQELMAYDDVHRHIMEEVTGVGVRYAMPGGELAGTGARTSLPGRRMPDLDLVTVDGEPVTVAELLRGGRGLLLTLSDGVMLPAAAQGWADRVDLVTAKPVEPAPAAAVLIRPDGHVAWAGDGADAERLLESLATWFGAARA
ncbi:FAD-dependent monooxygenase [Streptomyces sp. NRRL F-5126]|uniref:FAD-dependent monooxygenase n=1 Tax=Streptomyces sp. NRRL F-5126 TaxID=1463857 RepID=UPI0004C5BDA7|nr:FAD-dependent monooxygenase [Streptomyces sp. NRRL F-5126]